MKSVASSTQVLQQNRFVSSSLLWMQGCCMCVGAHMLQLSRAFTNLQGGDLAIVSVEPPWKSLETCRGILP